MAEVETSAKADTQAAAKASSGKKLFVPTDFLKFEFVGDPRISPDGEKVAYVRTLVDAKENKYRSTIMVAPYGGASPTGGVPFTSGVNADSAPKWSPDGRYLAFLSGRDAGAGDEEAKKKAGAQIWVAPTAGGEARPVTAIKGGVNEYVWSPDSRLIAFTAAIKPEGPEWLDEESKKDGAREGASAKADTGAGDGAGAGAVAGTGECASPAAPGAASASDPTADDLESLFKKHTEGVKHITRALYRADGVGYLEDKRTQVFVVDVTAALAELPQPGKGPSIRPVQVTHGDFDHGSPAFSPSGDKILVSACRDPNPDLRENRDIWVFAVPDDRKTRGGANGGGEPIRLTSGTGAYQTATWSPDGRRVAILGNEMEYLWYSDDKLWLLDLDPDGKPAGKPRCLTSSFGRSFTDNSITDTRVGGWDSRPVWSPDGKFVFLLASDQGTTHLFAVDVATGKVGQLTAGDKVVFDWSTDASCRRHAFAVATAGSPNDIYVGELPGTPWAKEGAGVSSWPAGPASLTAPEVIKMRPVTQTNAALLEEHYVGLPERFTFHAPGGPEVDGWAIRPFGPDGGGASGEAAGGAAGVRRYPTILFIHGGPMAMYAGTFFFEMQLAVSAGMGVVFTNPRGSQGYGEQFCAGIMEEWGKNDYDDIMTGLDEAIRRFPWIDPERLGVTGGSYGGYMTSWLVGHTDRFKAACSTRAVNNCHSFFGTSDTGYQWDKIWHGTPWKDWENLIRQSPITYAGNVKTPTLVIHNEGDHRCLIEQGEQFYIALKKLGVETEFIRYPDESHGMSRGGKPWRRIHRLKSIIGWFERHLKG